MTGEQEPSDRGIDEPDWFADVRADLQAGFLRSPSGPVMRAHLDRLVDVPRSTTGRAPSRRRGKFGVVAVGAVFAGSVGLAAAGTLPEPVEQVIGTLTGAVGLHQGDDGAPAAPAGHDRRLGSPGAPAGVGSSADGRGPAVGGPAGADGSDVGVGGVGGAGGEDETGGGGEKKNGATPAVPATPAQPSATGGPATPATPATPAQPSATGGPATPATPATPAGNADKVDKVDQSSTTLTPDGSDDAEGDDGQGEDQG